jgi:hypothetical protein
MPTIIKSIASYFQQSLLDRINNAIVKESCNNDFSFVIMGDDDELKKWNSILDDRWIIFNNSFVLFEKSDNIIDKFISYFALRCRLSMINYIEDTNDIKNIEHELFYCIHNYNSYSTDNLLYMITDFINIMNPVPLVDSDQEIWDDQIDLR